MSRVQWDIIKQTTSFHINGYRLGVSLLVGSLILNTIFCVLIFYSHFTQPEPEYYATNGITALVQLDALPEPNNSPKALLAPDPLIDKIEKLIPQ